MRIESAKSRNATWYGGTPVANPVAGTVIADTGPVTVSPDSSEFKFEFDLLVVFSTTTSNVLLSLEHRNADNSANVAVATHIIPSGLSVLSVPIRLRQNERVRVVAPSNITGDVSASIFVVRLYD